MARFDADRRRAAQDAILLTEELKARKAVRDGLFWLQNCTKTEDEQDPLDPYKPFPDKPYFRPLWDLLNDPEEKFVYGLKSRTMMGSWLYSGWCAHTGFTTPVTKVVFQSEDEDKAVHDVDNVKILWRNSDPLLKAKWKLAKDLDKQPYDRLEMANGSTFLGIPGKNPDRIRSLHPTIYVQDESAIIARGEDSLNIAVATRCLKVLCLSSAEEGWYDDLFKKCKPVDWPIKKEKAA